MGWVVVEMQVLIAYVGDPIEVAENAVGKCMAPSTHQNGAHHIQSNVGQYSNTEHKGHMKAHAQFAANFNLTQSPRPEGTDGANGDDLP